MLGEVIVDQEGVTAVVADMLSYRAPAVRGDVLQRCRLRGGRADHNGVVHGAGFPQLVDDLGHGRTLLADGDVDARYVAAFLVNNRVDGNCGFARLPITND